MKACPKLFWIVTDKSCTWKSINAMFALNLSANILKLPNTHDNIDHPEIVHMKKIKTNACTHINSFSLIRQYMIVCIKVENPSLFHLFIRYSWIQQQDFSLGQLNHLPVDQTLCRSHKFVRPLPWICREWKRHNFVHNCFQLLL